MADLENKILYTEIDEEVSSILDRLKAEKEANIELVFPRRALVLQSLVSLKLLQKQAKKLEKVITIVTADKKGRELATSIGLDTRSSTSTPKKAKEEASEKEDAPQIRVAKKNEAPRSHGSKSIQDVISANHYESKVSIEKADSPQTASDFKKKHHLSPSLEAGTLNRKLLVFFTSLSLIMLAVVFMVILPSTTISIKPKSDVISFDANIKIVDADLGREQIDENPNRYIPSYKVSAQSQLTETFQTTGVAQNGANAEGIITIKNDGGSNQTLIRRTRFRSDDGVIYRLMEGVQIPRGSNVTARVVADPLDENGEITGSRGNKTEGRLTIPGLREANQAVIYGEITEPISGGVSESTKIASADDIESAKQKLVEALTQTLKQSLQKEASALGKSIDKELRILDTPDAIKQVSLDVALANGVQAEDPAEEFTISVSLALEAVAFDDTEFKRILDRGLLGRVTPDTKIVKIKYDEVDYAVLEGEQTENEYTVDTSIEAVIKYDIEGYYKDIIVQNISGKQLPEAIEYLKAQNFLTGNAKVRMWPFWLTRIPSLADNIKIKELE